MVAKIKNSKTESVPRSVVTSIVSKLQKEGYSVKTRINQCQNRIPCGVYPKYENYTPDIFAFKGMNNIVIIEFENSTSITSSENENKWKVLSSKPGLDFHVIVPSNCIKKAMIKSKIKNIPVNIHCIKTWKNTLEFDMELSK